MSTRPRERLWGTMADRAAVLITSDLPFDEWIETFDSVTAAPEKTRFALTELRHSRKSGNPGKTTSYAVLHLSGNPHAEGTRRLMRRGGDKSVELGRAPTLCSRAASALPGSSSPRT